MEGTILEEYKKHLRNKKLSAKTISDYSYYIYNLEGEGELTQQLVNRLVARFGINSGLRGAVFSYKEFLEINGAEETKIIIPKVTGRKPIRITRKFTNEELDNLSAYFYNRKIKDWIIFELIRQGALRRNELLSIKINSFDWESYLEGKNDKIENTR